MADAGRATPDATGAVAHEPSPRVLRARANAHTDGRSLIVRLRIVSARAAVSGFTNLCTRLDIDVLQLHINEYFTRLVNVVTRFGGDVVRFAGDAL